MSRFNLRKKPRISYYEPDEPNLDEYIFCTECADYVYEYCAIHGPLLVVPDDKVPPVSNVPSYVPRSALTIPHVFLHIAPSSIPDAGLGVFSTLTLPAGVRFGPYRGRRTADIDSHYCWQIYNANRVPSHVVDGSDPHNSNWMRFVNCSRNWREQNLLAFQYQGEIYYRTLRIIPRGSELLVYYGSEFALRLGIDLRRYNAPTSHNGKMGALSQEKKQNSQILKVVPEDIPSSEAVIPSKQLILSNNENIINLEDTVKSKQTDDIKKSIFFCDHCNRKFSSKIILTRHILNHYITSKNVLMCKLCGMTFNHKRSLNNHLLQDHPNSKRTNYTNSQTHNTSEKPYVCSHCDKRFTQQYNLKRHIRTHTGEKPYVCSHCDKRFTQQHHLQYHIRTHTGEKPYVCSHCDKRFTQQSYLKSHIRTHTGEKPYVCSHCDKRFTQQSNLKSHIRTQTGEKPYVCSYCDKRFTQKSNLKNHIRTHTGEKPYVCSYCDKRFTHQVTLNIHIRTHALSL